MKPSGYIGIFITITAIVCLFPFEGLSYEKETHFLIDRIMLQETIQGFSLDAFLKTSLGLSDGIMSSIAYDGSPALFQDNGDEEDDGNPYAWRWIASGGVYEDLPFARCFLHFHDPLKPWSEAGYAGTYESASLWGQNSDQAYGNYAWDDVRAYYYMALTRGGQEHVYYLGETLRGIGQLMHLIQDMSVPAHTRDDGHIWRNFEQYINYISFSKRREFENRVLDSSQYTYNKAILEIPMSDTSVPLVPIARLVDTDTYTREELNPEATVGQSIGLAEYTNANFFSEDTIFDSTYPFPNYNSVEVAYLEIENPRNPEETRERAYYFRKTGYGDTGYALATVPYAAEAFGLTLDFAPLLDDFVYNDYAERLIPRAVSYSNGLLEYFFRGTIALNHKPEDSQSSSRFLSLFAENTTDGDELMTDGSIELVVFSKASASSAYQTVVIPEFNSVRAIPSGSRVELVFDISTVPCLSYEQFYYVVYRGRLGLEDDAVAVGYTNAFPWTWGMDFGTWLYRNVDGKKPWVNRVCAAVLIREDKYADEWGQTLVYRAFNPPITGTYRLTADFDHNSCCNGVGLTTSPEVENGLPAYDFDRWLDDVYLSESGSVTYHLDQGITYYLGIYFYEGSSETPTSYYMDVWSWEIKYESP